MLICRVLRSKWTKACLVAGTVLFGILPGSCNEQILRWAVPVLLQN